jgi:hypothetical protein
LAILILATSAAQAQTNRTDVRTSPPELPQFNKEVWQVRRLEAPQLFRSKTLKLDGPVVRVLKSPAPKQLLQLVNPFAPLDIGAGEFRPVAWNAFAGAGVRPRAFRDPLTEEPLPLISVGR